jgi:hypothetical protein
MLVMEGSMFRTWLNDGKKIFSLRLGKATCSFSFQLPEPRAKCNFKTIPDLEKK